MPEERLVLLMWVVLSNEAQVVMTNVKQLTIYLIHHVHPLNVIVRTEEKRYQEYIIIKLEYRNC